MALMKVRRDTEQDPGVPFVFGVDSGNGKPVRLWLRRVPPSVRASIAKRHGDNVIRVRNKGIVQDPDARWRERRDVAAYAVVKVENFALQADDQAAADAYSRLAGAPVQVGGELLFDAIWGQEAAREAALEDAVSVTQWVHERLEELEAQAAEVEAGKGRA